MMLHLQKKYMRLLAVLLALCMPLTAYAADGTLETAVAEQRRTAEAISQGEARGTTSAIPEASLQKDAGIVGTGSIQRGRSVPVLMYHAVSDDVWGIPSLFVSPSTMRSQLEYLKNNGYQTVFLSDLTHLQDYNKPIVLTLDDGYDDNYYELYPLLQEFQMKATIFMVTNSIGKERRLTEQQLREMSDSGLVSIQSHTASHQRLAGQSASAQEYELRQSQSVLERITGQKPYALSYPEGNYSKTTVRLMQQYYDFGFRSWGGRWTVNDNFYEIKRHPIDRDMSMREFEECVDESVQNIFTDVSASAWYVPYVQRVYDKNLMHGMSGNTFAPNQSLTRAQLVQILYNKAGKPAVTIGNPFYDVANDKWYTQAVLWAKETGVTKGVSETQFAPNAAITREQLATLLHRYSGTPAGTGVIDGFPDAWETSAWAWDAMVWANGIGMVQGSKLGGRNYLQPKNAATRAQTAKMIDTIL